MSKKYYYDVIMAEKKDRKLMIGAVKLSDGTVVMLHRDGKITVSLAGKWHNYFTDRSIKKVPRPVSFTLKTHEVDAIFAGLKKMIEWDEKNNKSKR